MRNSGTPYYRGRAKGYMLRSAALVMTLIAGAGAGAGVAPSGVVRHTSPGSVQVSGPWWSCDGGGSCIGSCRWTIIAPTYQYFTSSSPSNATNLDVLLPDAILAAAKQGHTATTDPAAFASVRSILLVLPVEVGARRARGGWARESERERGRCC